MPRALNMVAEITNSGPRPTGTPMTNALEIPSEQPSGWTNPRMRRARGGLVLLMGCLAILASFFAGSLALFLVGLLLIACGALEMLETFHAASEAGRRSAYWSGVLSILAGILLLAQPQLLLRGLALFLAGSFFID